MLEIIRKERFLGAGVATSLAFLLFGTWLHRDYSNPLYLTLILAWLFFTILGSVLAVVRHADHLAERLGEPYGTWS
jgi:Ca2+:H+ antiporter